MIEGDPLPLLSCACSLAHFHHQLSSKSGMLQSPSTEQPLPIMTIASPLLLDGRKEHGGRRLRRRRRLPISLGIPFPRSGGGGCFRGVTCGRHLSFRPSFLPQPHLPGWAVQSVSPIPNLSFFWIFQQFQTHILGDFFMKPEMWLAAQTTRQQGGLLLHLLLFPLSRAPRAPFGQVKLRKGGGRRRRRRNQWHLLSSAWSRRRRRSRPQEAGRIRFLKSAHLKG